MSAKNYYQLLILVGSPAQKKFYAVSKLGSTIPVMYSNSHVVAVPVVPYNSNFFSNHLHVMYIVGANTFPPLAQFFAGENIIPGV